MARKENVSNDAFAPWLNSAESARAFNNIRATSGSPLEDLRKVENEISGMKLAEVSRYLEGRIAATNRKISVLGATIDEPLAIIGGPIAVFLPLLYLLLLSWQLANLPSSKLAAAENYPWIVLMPGWQGNAVRVASGLLPVAVCLWLFLNSAKSASLSAVFISLGINLLIAVAAFLAVKQFWKLRNKIGH